MKLFFLSVHCFVAAFVVALAAFGMKLDGWGFWSFLVAGNVLLSVSRWAYTK